jgi:hypothetical protein
MVKFYTWQNERAMSGKQYKEILKELDLSQAAAGRWLDYSERTSNRYAMETLPIPLSVAFALRALAETGALPIIPPYEGVRAMKARWLAEQNAGT